MAVEPAPVAPPPGRAEEFRRRLLDVDWKDVGDWKPEDLVAGMRLYIDSDDPAWPKDDPRYRRLTRFLIREEPAPVSLRSLLGPYDGTEVTVRLLKRDKIARAVLHSFMGRIWRKDQANAADLWDQIVYASVHFSFEPLYESSHPGAGESIGEFLTDPQISACAESEAAFRKYLQPLLAKWRGRVTRKATSIFFGNLLRHVGPDVAELLFAEWAGMDANERVDLMRRVEWSGELGPIGRAKVVEAVLDESFEAREAAFDLLAEVEAPLGDLDASSREDRIEKALPALRKWARETKS